MKRRWSFTIHHSLQTGFTFVELVIGIAIIGIVSSFSIYSFSGYSKTQSLVEATKGVASTLQVAKSRASTQVKPTSCGTQPLQGYRVVFCGLGTPCLNTGNLSYELQVACGSSYYLINLQNDSNMKFPGDVRFNTTYTTSSTIFYKILTGGVERGGNITVTNGSRNSQIQVDRFGNMRMLENFTP